jgi:hypothetical protein
MSCSPAGAGPVKTAVYCRENVAILHLPRLYPYAPGGPRTNLDRQDGQ